MNDNNDAHLVDTRYADGRILATTDQGVGLITFNNPAKHNAMTLDMWQALGPALDGFARDDAVRVAVLAGAGARAFVSGADIGQFDTLRAHADAQRRYQETVEAGWCALAGFPKPLIARVRGFCLGGGLAIAMAADIRIAAEDSEFGIPAARLGIAYAPYMVRRLVELVGPAEAHMILFTGARFPAGEARQIGLVNRVVPDSDLSETVIELARVIADNAPLSIAASKRSVAEVTRDPGERDPDAERAAIDVCFDSADYREGRTAFMQKRTPKFEGR